MIDFLLIINIYLFCYLMGYIIFHMPFDIIMILKRKNISYPRAEFASIFQTFSLVVPTLIYWLFIIFQPIFHFFFKFNLNFISFISILPEGLILFFQITGITISLIGLIIGCLGRIGRGLYLSYDEPKLSTSWGHSIVRHPQYLLYITGFISLPILTLNPLFLFLYIGIPAYINEAGEEDKVLLSEFGEEYKEYMKKVGKLFPKMN